MKRGTVRLRLNLASQEYRLRRKIRWTLWILTLLLLSILGREGMLYNKLSPEEGNFQVRIKRIADQEEELRKRLQALGLKANEESFRQLRSEISFANDLIYQKAFSWTQFLSELEAPVPKDVAISGIQPSFKSGQVTIVGTARSLKDLTMLLIQLESNPRFEEVFLSNQTVNSRGIVKDSVKFSIQFQYRGKQTDEA